MPYGFYYLDEALNEKEIKEEVSFIEKFIEENATSMNKLPLVIDLEYQNGKGRADEIWEERETLITALINQFKQVNIETIVYANYNRANEYLSDLDSMFWIAHYKNDGMIPEKWIWDTGEYDTTKEFQNKVIGWQFSEMGAPKNGINEALDFSLVKNKFFRDIIKQQE